jgi:two-component system NarL family sensor kinase
MKKILLSEKLILYFVFLGIGAIAIISLVSFQSTKTALVSRTFDQLTSLRIVKKNQIEQFFTDRSRDVFFLASEQNAIEILRSLRSLSNDGTSRTANPANKRPANKSKENIQTLLMDQSNRFLSKIRSFKPHFSGYYIFQNSEYSICQSSSDPGSSGIRQVPKYLDIHKINTLLLDQPVGILDDIYDSTAMKPRLFIASRIRGTNGQDVTDSGTIVLEVALETIDTIMLNNNPLNGMGLSGETYLVGSDNKMRSTSRFQPNSILRTVVNTQSVTNAREGKEGPIITNDYRGIPVLSSYGKITIPGLDWVILAEIDNKEAMIPIYETRSRILLLSVLILIIFFIFVFFIARHITRPLLRLNNAAVKLGEGQYDIVLPVTTQDEIGLLTESFNIMARQIKEKTSELQQERFGRMRSVIDGEEMERQRLSRELHDGIGQLLIAIKLRLESLLYQDGKEIRNSIQELKKYFDQIIDEVRRISNNLMPSVLEAFGPAIAFRNLFADTEELSGIKIHFEAKGDFDNLDKKIQTYIYRLTQEALSNIVKHAEAHEVWVNLNRKADNLSLTIRDDGKGFSPEIAGKEGGNGIHNMRERVSLLNGHIEISSSSGKGTTISVIVPILIAHVNNQDFPRG